MSVARPNMASGGCSLPNRVACSQQHVASGGQRQPPATPLPLAPRLQRQPLGLSLSFALLYAVTGQLLKCLEVQHDASSSRVSSGWRDGVYCR